jgi:hypothetical protein
MSAELTCRPSSTSTRTLSAKIHAALRAGLDFVPSLVRVEGVAKTKLVRLVVVSSRFGRTVYSKREAVVKLALAHGGLDRPDQLRVIAILALAERPPLADRRAPRSR